MEEPNEVDRYDLRSIAIYQKAILICILIYFVTIITAQFVVPPALRFFLVIPVIGVIVAATVFVFLLAMKVYSMVVGVALAFLTLIPFVGLIVLLIINAKATTVLKRHGIAVGLLGARMSDLK